MRLHWKDELSRWLSFLDITVLLRKFELCTCASWPGSGLACPLLPSSCRPQDNSSENTCVQCQVEVLRVQKSNQNCWNWIISNSFISYKKVKNWKWPLVCSNPNISASTWPKLRIKDSFEILRTSRFQNWPYFLNLVKIWWRYCQKHQKKRNFLRHPL